MPRVSLVVEGVFCLINVYYLQLKMEESKALIGVIVASQQLMFLFKKLIWNFAPIFKYNTLTRLVLLSQHQGHRRRVSPGKSYDLKMPCKLPRVPARLPFFPWLNYIHLHIHSPTSWGLNQQDVAMSSWGSLAIPETLMFRLSFHGDMSHIMSASGVFTGASHNGGNLW